LQFDADQKTKDFPFFSFVVRGKNASPLPHQKGEEHALLTVNIFYFPSIANRRKADHRYLKIKKDDFKK